VNTLGAGCLAGHGWSRLERVDPLLHGLLEREHQRQLETLALVAACSVAPPAVLACQSHVISNVTVEGYPGARLHAGAEFADEVERLAVERAQAAFGARYANVQPHSGTSANEIVLFSLLRPGDCILGMDLDSGGHLTHGSRASISGRAFRAVGYGVGPHGLIDYAEVRRLALASRPRLIVCGASAYPRKLDFARFREIADEVGAYLLADISHIAGLVAAGEHPTPIDHAHVTTTSTYKQLWGPRGGLILMGRDFDRTTADGKTTLAAAIQKGVFPLFQGTPSLNQVAAKAHALALVRTSEFREWAVRVTTGARRLAHELVRRGYPVLTGGSDNHLLLLDVGARGLTGAAVEKSLEECNVLVNRNRIPGDTRAPQVASGIRLGTNVTALRGLGADQMADCADLIDSVLSALGPGAEDPPALPPAVRQTAREKVAELCERFPLRCYAEATASREQSVA
jgi:glycine hydroxymethyltransferase